MGTASSLEAMAMIEATLDARPVTGTFVSLCGRPEEALGRAGGLTSVRALSLTMRGREMGWGQGGRGGRGGCEAREKGDSTVRYSWSATYRPLEANDKISARAGLQAQHGVDPFLSC